MTVADTETATDVVVIGAGPAGYVAAIRAGQLGLDVTLIEKEAPGGTCLNHGCIPSKALITASDVAHEATSAEKMGIYADLTVDLSEMVTWKDSVVEQLTGGVRQLCRANGVTFIEGTATFIDEYTVQVHSDGGQNGESISFENAIIATGSRPIEIPNFAYSDEPVLNSRQALALDAVPDSMVVVGAGYIGMELASVFAKLGTDITVIEMLQDILPGYDDDLTQPVKRTATDLGIDFHFQTTAIDWEQRENGLRVKAAPVNEASDDAETPSETLELDAENVLVAVGREPVSDTLALEATGVDVDEQGFVPTTDRARTTVDHIFAAGDVAGEPMLAHKGSYEGKVAAEVIAGEPSAVDYRAMPAVIFTDPEIATVGMTEAEATEAGYDATTGEFSFRANGRALTTDRSDGFVRIVADADSGFVLGGQVVGPDASELAAELGLAVEMGATLRDVADTIHAHPTLSEAFVEAAEDALGDAIHSV